MSHRFRELQLFSLSLTFEMTSLRKPVLAFILLDKPGISFALQASFPAFNQETLPSSCFPYQYTNLIHLGGKPKLELKFLYYLKDPVKVVPYRAWLSSFLCHRESSSHVALYLRAVIFRALGESELWLGLDLVYCLRFAYVLQAMKHRENHHSHK